MDHFNFGGDDWRKLFEKKKVLQNNLYLKNEKSSYIFYFNNILMYWRN